MVEAQCVSGGGPLESATSGCAMQIAHGPMCRITLESVDATTENGSVASGTCWDAAQDQAHSPVSWSAPADAAPCGHMID